MTKILITIDVESRKEVRDGKMHHLHYKEDIETPCKRIIRIADIYGAKVTFMMPLSEILVDHKKIAELLNLMNINHDVQVHLHRPIPLLTEKELTEILRNEVDMIEEFTWLKPVAIRAGGYNVGKGAKWIRSVLNAGLEIDCSVWPGVSTLKSKRIRDIAVRNEERYWGNGALYFDFRGAPMSGPYKVSDDDVARVGNSKLVEIPITVSKYEEVNPWKYRFDPKNQGVRQMRNTVLQHSDKDVIEMFWHSNRIIFKGVDVSWIYMMRFERILKFLAKRDVEFVTMSEVGEGIRGSEIFVEEGMNKK